MLHEDDTRPILTVDIFGVAEKQSKKETNEHQDNEGNVGAIADCAIGLNVNVLPKRNLEAVNQ